MPTQQRHLTLTRRPPQKLDYKLIHQQPTLLAAVKLCISMGGFEADKEVYGPLGIDAGHWSRIHRGEAHFPLGKLCDLMDLCGNEAPMLWLLDERGYDLHSLRRQETETERELRLAHEEIERMRAERRAERNLLSEVMAGRLQVAAA